MQKRFLFVFFFTAFGLMAQSETGRAALEGTVSDPSGKSVASVDITVHGFTISTLFLAHSGYPVKAVVGADLQNDGNSVNDVPVINGVIAYRNTFRQPGASVNPKTGFAFSSNTALIPVNSPGTDFFGGVRQAQLGVRFVF